MRNFHFQKDISGRWFVDLPEWEGTKDELEMVMGADTMLDVISCMDNDVWITLSTEPFENFTYKLTFKEEIYDGATYGLEGNYMEFDVWLCSVTKFVFGEFPDEIFLR